MPTFLYTSNGLYVCGSNEFGESGLGKNSNKKILSPTRLNFFNDHEIISIQMGYGHTLIQTNKGVFGFGMNGYGQLGLGDTKDRESPTRLKFFDNHEIISVKCGYDHTIIYTTDGLFGFGRNDSSQLGLGDYCERHKPTKLDFFDNYTILSIYCVGNHTFVNTHDGLYVFGDNIVGVLGLGDYKKRNIPKKLKFFDNYEIVSINGGPCHTIIETTTGIFVCGGNCSGQLGLGDTTSRNVLSKLNFFDNHKITSIECGNAHSMINTNYGLYVFGDKIFGKLGLGCGHDKTMPTKLNFFDNYQILSISCFGHQSVVFTTEGLYMFGDNRKGGLGLGDTKNRYTPTKLDFEHEIIPLGNNPKRIKSARSFV